MTDDPAEWGYYRPASEFFDGMGDEEIAEWREELRSRESNGWTTPLEWKALRLMPKRLRIYDATGIDSSGMNGKERRRAEYAIAHGRPVVDPRVKREELRTRAMSSYHSSHSKRP
jgi:hypothetical protein